MGQRRFLREAQQSEASGRVRSPEAFSRSAAQIGKEATTGFLGRSKAKRFPVSVEKEESMRQWLIRAICLAWLVAGSLTVTAAQNQMPEPAPSDGPSRFVRRPLPANTTYAIRVVNAAESAYRQIHGKFGSWQQLYDSGALVEVQKAVEQWHRIAFATGPEAIPGYHLSLLVSADGSAYSVSVRDTDSGECGVSLFSDQNGLIYRGAPLDCSETVEWPLYSR